MRESRVKKPVLAQARAQFRIEKRQRAGKPHAHRAGLSAHAAAIHGGDDVNRSRRLGELHRLDGAIAPGHVAKIFIRRAAIDGNLAGPERQEDARNGFLAPAGAVKFLFRAFQQAVRWNSTFLLTSKILMISIRCWNAAGPGCLLVAKVESLLRLKSSRLRFLPRVPRQTLIIQINPQFLRAQRPQFILRQHAQHGFAQHPVRARRPQAAWPELPSARRDIRCDGGKFSAPACFRSGESCRR